MKRKLSAEAIEAMRQGGRNASRADKARAGRKGFQAMLKAMAKLSPRNDARG